MKRFFWTGLVCATLAMGFVAVPLSAQSAGSAASEEQIDAFDRAQEMREQGAYAQAKDILLDLKSQNVYFGPERDLDKALADVNADLIEFYENLRERDRSASITVAELKAGREEVRRTIDRKIARAARLEEQGRLDDAEALYEEAAGDYIESRIREGLELARRGYYEDAENIFIEAQARLEQHPVEIDPQVREAMREARESLDTLQANQQAALVLLASRGEIPVHVPGKQMQKKLYEEYVAKARAGLEREDPGAAREWLSLAADMPQDDLTEQQRNELTALWARVTQMEAAQREAMESQLAEIEKKEQQVERSRRFLEEVQKTQEVREDRARALAQDQYELAEKAYGSLQLEDALQWAEQALKTYPGHEAAAQLRGKILAAMGERAPAERFREETREFSRVRREMAEAQLVANREQANRLKAQEEYSDALRYYEEAKLLAEWLGPDFEPQARAIGDQIEETRELLAEMEARREREERREAEDEAVQARRLQDLTERRERAQFLRMAYEEYTRGKYDSAIQLCETIDQIDPGNQAARELRQNAIEAQRSRDWQVLERENKEARRREVLKLKEKLLWQDAIVKYPARSVWRDVVRRGPVPMPSGEAVKTPADLDLELALETEVEFNFESTPLRDVVEFLRQIVEKNIILDEQAIAEDERLITMTLSRTPLRNALNLILEPIGMGYIINQGAIYISTKPRLLAVEPKDFRIYDIRDLAQSQARRAGGAVGDDDDDDGGFGDDDDDDTSSGSTDVVGLIYQLTGRENWQSVTVVGGGDDDDDDTGGFGLDGDGDGGGFDEFGEGEFGAAEEQIAGGGTMVLREPGDLLVTQSDRVHSDIERIITALRDQVDVQITIEARIINFTDDFYREVGTNWTNITWKNREYDLGLFKFPKMDWEIPSISPSRTAPSGAIDILPDFQINATFLDYQGMAAFIRLVKGSDYAQVMQAPSITLINTQEGSIEVTRNQAYVASYTIGEAGAAQPTVSTFTTGVSLTVMPVISADRRYVELLMDPSVTTGALETFSFATVTQGDLDGDDDADDSPSVVSTTLQQPVEDEQTVDTVVRVPDRGSLIMGGLSRVADYRQESGLPFLSHVPFIKRLFTRVSEYEQRQHLLMTVTPTILIQEEMEALIPH